LVTVPLDNSWRTNFHTLPDFVRFAHEMTYYLAGARSAERNLAPGQPIVFSPRPTERAAAVTVQPPEGSAKVVPVKQWPLVFDATRDPGAYKLTTSGGRTYFFAVRSDPQESVLTPNSEDDRKNVSEIVKGLQYIVHPNDIESKKGEGPQTRELWWLLLLLVLALLAGEVWYTRKLAQRGQPL